VDRIKITKYSALVMAYFKQSMEMCLSWYRLKLCQFFNLLVGSVLSNEIMKFSCDHVACSVFCLGSRLL
jgi:hypothetical protein